MYLYANCVYGDVRVCVCVLCVQYNKYATSQNMLHHGMGENNCNLNNCLNLPDTRTVFHCAQYHLRLIFQSERVPVLSSVKVNHFNCEFLTDFLNAL